jgi:dihydrofolate synthase / folylpolyglutamate synthase
MNYQETLHYLYSRLPMFSKLGVSAIKKDLTNTIELCKRLNHPEASFKTIHIGGTNGKGSVSHMLAAVLQTAGYKTGLYTSPHLRDFRERIRINGNMISENEVVDFVSELQSSIEEIEPSFFEVTVALAFQHFAKNKVDIAVIEVGLGGRLDSTNVINPLLSVITNIGYDHTNILGNTLPEIGYEKAGIIKANTPVVIGERHPETIPVFTKKANEMLATLCFAEDEWIITGDSVIDGLLHLTAKHQQNELALALDLTGTYQLNNIKTVLCAVDELRQQNFVITDEHLRKALKQVKQLTGLMGRWQTLSSHPLIICDTGHNEHGIKQVVKNINATPYKKLHMVIGMVKDKDITTVLSLLPKEATYYFCSPEIERAKAAADLQLEAAAFNLKGEAYTSVAEALANAKQQAKEEDLIFIGGSTFVVAEII